MLMSDFGMNVKISLRLDITIQNLWIDLMLRIFLRVLEMHPMGCDKKTFRNSYGLTQCKLVSLKKDRCLLKMIIVRPLI